MRSMFDEYVKNRTLQNWKFWIVSFYHSIKYSVCIEQTLGVSWVWVCDYHTGKGVNFKIKSKVALSKEMLFDKYVSC